MCANAKRTKKELKISDNHLSEKNFYLSIINSINSDGRLPRYDGSFQKMNYYLKHLRIENIIKKVGYGTWQIIPENLSKLDSLTTKKNVKKSSKDGLVSFIKRHSKKDIRGHGFMVTLELPKIAGWHKRAEFLKKKRIHFKPVGIRDSGQAINFQGYKIHLFKKSIVIYYSELTSYFSDSAQSSQKSALYDLSKLFNALESFFNIKLREGKQFKFAICKQHYAHIKDELAKHCRESNQKIEVRDKNGRLWLLVDFSLNTDELETVEPATSPIDMDKVVMPFFNDQREHFQKTGESILSSELLKANIQNSIQIQDLIKATSLLTEAQKLQAENSTITTEQVKQIAQLLSFLINKQIETPGPESEKTNPDYIG